MKKLVLPLLLLFILLSTADGRFWTNQKGKSFEGEFIEADDNNVIIRRSSDRIIFTMLIKDLSDADQGYLTKLEEEKKKKKSVNLLTTTCPRLKKNWLSGLLGQSGCVC